MTAPDRRLNAYRPDLADARLQGRVEAARFVAGRPARVATAVADLRPRPEAAAGIDTQLLCGDAVTVFDAAGGWAWVQAAFDGYVGYLPAAALAPPGPRASHVVTVPRSFVYPVADLKAPRLAERSLGSGVTVTDVTETRGTRYALLAEGGAMVAGHLRPAGEPAGDYVAVAETLAMAPYLWGGTSGFGIDCSGLVQLAMRMAGRTVPRDSDLQAQIGVAVDPAKGLARGDLVFWTGHVAIMTDAANALHANGATMLVSHEPLERAVARIAPLFGAPTGYRRPG